MQLKGIFLVFLVPLPDYLKGSQTFCRFHERRIFPIPHISSSKVYSVPVCVYVCMSLVTQSYPTLYDPMDCSLLGSFAHGILQARILEWVAISFSRGSSRSDPGIKPRSPALQANALTSAPPGKPRAKVKSHMFQLASKRKSQPVTVPLTLTSCHTSA